MMRKFLAISLVLAGLVVSTPGFPDSDKNLGIALKHYGSKNYKTAKDLLLKQAIKGEPIAMYVLGEMYSKGLGVTPNLDKAEHWYVNAVKNETIEIDQAMLGLGLQFYYGDRVNRDYTKAEHWFRKASEMGNSFAAYSMFVMHFEIHENFSEGMAWLEVAARRGHLPSQLALGKLNGMSTNKLIHRNTEQGIYWCRQALANPLASEKDKIDAKTCVESINLLDNQTSH